MPWQNHKVGIAMGFGVFASIEFVAIALRAQGKAAGAANSAICSWNQV
jgi:hypothetical protein